MHSDSSNLKIYNRIKDMPGDSVFSAQDFLDIAEYNTVRQALLRLEKDGKIQKLMRGLYYHPAYSSLLEEYEAPSMNKTAEAIARKFNWNIVPTGDTALNILGLSTQVPAKWEYYTDGPYHSFKIGNLSLDFKHRNNREISGMSADTAMVIQALKSIGRDRITDEVLSAIRRRFDEDSLQVMLQESKQSSMWIHEAVRRMCGSGEVQ